MEEKQQMSVQAGLGMLAQGLSALLPEKAIDTKQEKTSMDEKKIILPYSEYNQMLEAIQKKEESRQEIYNQCRQDIEYQIGQSIESLVGALRWYNARNVSEYIDKKIKDGVKDYKRQYDNIYDEYKKLRITLEQMKEEQENKEVKCKWWQIWKR